MSMTIPRNALLLLAPAVVVFVVLLGIPLLLVVEEGFREYIPGRIGSAADAPFTFQNYRELLEPAYVGYFLDTFRIGLIASLIGLVIAFPIAHFVARQRSRTIRTLAVGFLISMMFLSALVRVYSIALTMGSVGFGLDIARLLGVGINSRFFTEFTVISGLLHYIVPMAALTLVGTIQNVNPRLADAAMSLGAARWKAHLSITVPLSLKGILSAFLISYTLCISAFVIPMVLGKGRVLFVSNLIYRRFSEVANYPSGAAISVIMTVLSLLIVYFVTRVVMARVGRV